MSDSSFCTGSNEAAKRLKEWCTAESKYTVLDEFTEALLGDLRGTFSEPSGRCPLNREKMWRAVFHLRSSATFISRWQNLLQMASATSTPILYQHITDLIFRKLICEHYESTSTHESSTSSHVTDNEMNALRYAAGYIVRNVTKKICATPMFKEDLVNCCQKLVKVRFECEDTATAEVWTDLVDRGGLWHVKESTFQLMCAFEEEIRKHLNTLSSTGGCTPGVKEKFVGTLMSSEDVQFYWCIVTANFEADDPEVHDCILKMIIQLFVTVRGFAYASSWIEHYKQGVYVGTHL